jgi:hypothetical protein
MATFYGGQAYDPSGGETKTFDGKTITGAKIMNGHWVGMLNGGSWSASPGVEPDGSGNSPSPTPGDPASPIGGLLGANPGGGGGRNPRR